MLKRAFNTDLHLKVVYVLICDKLMYFSFNKSINLPRWSSSTSISISGGLALFTFKNLENVKL